jgi:dTDP-4-amino-4,6-dideoxygalactose transaminase
VRFYRIRQDLSLDLEDLNQQLSGDVAAILVIHFLGFPTPLDDILSLRQKFDCYLIEDWAHSFLLGPKLHIPGEQGDFALLSFYKHVPSYAGGGLRVNVPIPWSLEPRERVSGRQAAVIARRMLDQAINNSSSAALKAVFQKFEEWRAHRIRGRRPETHKIERPIQDSPYEFSERLALAGIPWLCRRVLEASLWKSIFEARQRNYRLLAQHIEENSLFRKVHPALPDDVCPWAFPVWLPLRSEHDFRLRARGVPLFTFGETLHPLSRQCPAAARKDAEDLSQHLLLLSVHQNLEVADMERTAGLINEFYRRRP